MKINGLVLADERDRAGLSQIELGELAGISASYLSKMELGVKTTPSVSVVQDLAAVLGLPLMALASPETTVEEVDRELAGLDRRNAYKATLERVRAEQAQAERRDAAAESASSTSEPVASSSKASDGWPW
jgi:transcriptional regulator with XRE-family HTH domain